MMYSSVPSPNSDGKSCQFPPSQYEQFTPEEYEALFGRLVLYEDDDINQLYQRCPSLGTEDHYPSFTNSICSYIKQAKNCIDEILESKAKPKWYAVVRIDDILTAQDHNQHWKLIARRLRQKKVVALWTREATKANRLHYNFLISYPTSETEMEDAIRFAFGGMKINLKAKRIDQKKILDYVFYVFKGKRKGKIKKGPKDKVGEWSSDMYQYDRLLFKKHSPLRKHDCIGQFYGDRKAVRVRVKTNRKANAERRNEDGYLLDCATKEEIQQAQFLFEYYGRYVGWKKADGILLELVKTRMGKASEPQTRKPT